MAKTGTYLKELKELKERKERRKRRVKRRLFAVVPLVLLLLCAGCGVALNAAAEGDITLNMNFEVGEGATGTPPDSMFDLSDGDELILPEPTESMQKTEFYFAGWKISYHNGDPYANGDVLSPGTSVTLDKHGDGSSQTFTAVGQWKPALGVEFQVGDATGTLPEGLSDLPDGYVLTLPQPADMKKDGYAFDGWSIYNKNWYLYKSYDHVAAGATVTLEKMWPDAYETFYVKAQWTPLLGVEFRVGDGAEGTPPEAMVDLPDGYVLTLPQPTESMAKEHYTFDGWIIYYENWNPYDNRNHVAAGDTITLVKKRSDDYETFLVVAQWKSALGVEFQVGDGAKGTPPEAMVDLPDGYVLTLPEPTESMAKEHYTFDGWNIYDKNWNVYNSCNHVAAGDTITLEKRFSDYETFYVKAQWKSALGVKFWAGDGATGTPPEEMVDLPNGYVLTLPEPTESMAKEHYTFDGWIIYYENWNPYDNRNHVAAGDTITLEKRFSDYETFYVKAQWKPALGVEFQVGDGATGDPPDSMVDLPDGYELTLPQPTESMKKAGYTFDGWSIYDKNWNVYNSCNHVAAGKIVTLEKKQSYYETFIVKAQWKPALGVEFQVGNGAEGTPPEAMVDLPDGYVLTLPQPTESMKKAGYTFDGWNIYDKNWTPYNWNPNDTRNHVAAGDTITLVKKWPDAYETFLVVAQWKPALGVEFQVGDGAEGTPPEAMVDLPDGYVLTLPQPTESMKKAGYGFAGWLIYCFNDNYYETRNSIHQPGDTVTLNKQYSNGYETFRVVAQWAQVTYQINYNTNLQNTTVSGMPSAASNLKIGNFTKEDDHYYYPLSDTTPSGSGYTFRGWGVTPDTAPKDGVTRVEIDDFPTPPTGTFSTELTVYAIWSPNAYVLHYEANEPSGMDSVSVPSDKPLNFLDHFTATKENPGNNDWEYSLAEEAVLFAEGFTFRGWNTQADASDGQSAVNIISFDAAGQCTLYAIWTENTYELRYQPGSKHSDAQNMPVNEPLTYTDVRNDTNLSQLVPSDTGYTFTGWQIVYPENDQSVTLTLGAGGTVPFEVFAANPTVTATAQWSENRYDLRYDAGGKTLTDDSLPAKETFLFTEMTDNAYIPVPNKTPKAAGYRFTGWTVGDIVFNSTNSEEKAIPFAAFDNAQGTAIAVAQWTPVQHSVTYNENRARIGDGAVIENMPNPLTETFDITGDRVNAEQTAYTLSEARPTATGYRCIGWNTDADASDALTSLPLDTTGTADKQYTVYAVWEEWQYTLSYAPGEGHEGVTVPEPSTNLLFSHLRMGNIKISTWVPSHDGFQFTGWQMQTGGRIYAVEDFGDSSKLTVAEESFDEHLQAVAVAQWIPVTTPSPETFTVTYLPGQAGGVDVAGEPATETYDEGMPANILSTCPFTAPDGYEFDGWTLTSPTGKGYPTSGTIPAVNHNIVYTAAWAQRSDPSPTPETFTVTYLPGQAGGVDVAGEPETETYDKGTPATVRSTCPFTAPSGYEFDGWTLTSPTGEGYPTSGTIPAVNHNIVYTAAWAQRSDPSTPPAANRYHITYLPGQADGAAVAGDVIEDSVTEGSSVNLRGKDTYVAPSGYEFDCWQPDKSGYPTEANATIVAVTENVTFTAVWKKQQGDLPSGSYKITYASGYTDDLGNNLGVVKEDVVTGTSYTVRDNADWTDYSRHGYAFVGWYVPPSSGGASVSPRSGSSVITPGTNIILTGNITFTAMWQANLYYHVTYHGNGESVSHVPSDSSDYGPRETATVLSSGSMTNGGMYFVRWDTDSNGNGTPYRGGDRITMTTNIDLYAIWSATPHDSGSGTSSDSYYTLTYHANGATGGTAPTDSTRYMGGEQVTVATQGSLTRRGCTFLEWNTSPDGTGTGYRAGTDTLTMPQHSLVLYAVWVDDDGVIVYDSPGTGENVRGSLLAVGISALSLTVSAWLLRRRRKSLCA